LDHRLDDANELEKKMVHDQLNEDEEPSTPDVDEHCITLEMCAKPPVIHHLLNESYGKINRIFYDVFI
jgi:hypothetical protein